MDDAAFSVKPVLDALRLAYGDGEFGYRMQALFAHVLCRLGGKVIEINAQGQPDIKAELRDETLLIQVKTIAHAGSSCEIALSADDIAGIQSATATRGYLSVLDCAVPVSWVLLRFEDVIRLAARPVHVMTIHAARDKPLSDECTQEFLEMVMQHAGRLQNLDFGILCRRALNGQAL